MIYRAIGIMSGSSLDGLDIVFTEFHENAGNWNYEILNTECYPYTDEWKRKLATATSLSALEYQLLHVAYGKFLGQQVNRFIEEYGLHYKVGLIASHGHTTFHIPSKRMSAQLGDGAALAAETQLPVVTDLRSVDVAFGGQGAPIVPIGERLLFSGYDYFLNIGGIANISVNADEYIAFDICATNRVLDMLAADAGKEYDKDGEMAGSGTVNHSLLTQLNELDYYEQPFPKSLANDFGTEIVYPMIRSSDLSTADSLRTYCEHIAWQVSNAIPAGHKKNGGKLFCTGGGSLNTFLVERIRDHLSASGIDIVVPDHQLVNFKEALIMGLIGVLRWRQEYNSIASVTGASRDSIGGALWTGAEA